MLGTLASHASGLPCAASGGVRNAKSCAPMTALANWREAVSRSLAEVSCTASCLYIPLNEAASEVSSSSEWHAALHAFHKAGLTRIGARKRAFF